MKNRNIIKKVDDEVNDLDKFRTRGARERSPIKLRYSDEKEEKREWRTLAVKKLGKKREVDNEITVKRRRKRQRARKR